MKYGDLFYISFFSKNKFLAIKKNVISSNIARIKKQRECKVGFVIYSSSMWSLDGLYQMFDNNPHFRPCMLIAPLVETTKLTYEETVVFFSLKGYEIQTPLTDSFDINSIDLLIYTTPFPFTDERVNTMSVRLDKLLCYVSYSYILSAKIEKLNLPTYLLSWKQLIEEKTRVYSNNAVYCGYPKMDSYYQKLNNKTSIKGKRITIIYAPHHSVSYSGVKSATFERNGWFLLFLAAKYKNMISWIVKPHPLLRTHSVTAGIFKNEDAYNDYLNRWRDLGVAEVVENGDYMDSFIESDAMITDSVSFLAEYQFTGNPLLLIESGQQTYNEFGQSICKVLYRCSGNDFLKIEGFLKNIIEGRDSMSEQRKLFFNSNLAYYTKENKFAYENMGAIFKKELFESEQV